MRQWIGWLLLTTLVLAACAQPAGGPGPLPTATPAEEPVVVTLMTHDSFAISESLLDQFEAETGATLKILRAGDAGAALNQAILSKGNPLADVFFGVDNTFFGRAIQADIFEPYESPMLADIPDELELDPQHRLLPVDFGYVCLNYDKAYFVEKGLAVPQTLEDLTKPEYKGLLVVENPATSSPGLAFLITTVAYFGEDGYLDFWRQLRENDVYVTDGWEDAYFGQFSGGSGEGTRPLVVSYATSPAAEVYFSEGKLDTPPTGNILPEGGSFRQIEFVGILKGTKHPDLARKLVDFMLSRPFQEDIPLQMFVYPANEKAALPELFEKFAQVPSAPAQITPEEIDAGRERWIDEWTATVLR
ncbi:MAG: thiamine ABC transporter substrate-binding protein [Chloroflexi bacterium]|nr:thiamine ABC transporter substrate-binding protein [Chloroflexota bacterium]